MIRRVAFSIKPRIPAVVREAAKEHALDKSFFEVQLDDLIPSIANQIPYSFERQIHTLIVLGNGGVESHCDIMVTDYNDTFYCIPFHLPQGATISQKDHRVALELGACYTFNHKDYHGVEVPDSCQTYSAFIVVSVLSLRGLEDERRRKEWMWRSQ